MSPEHKRRLKIFLSYKRAIFSGLTLFFLFTFSLQSEWISNSKPAVAIMGGRVFFPAYRDYNWQDFGKEGAGTVDYRELKEQFSWAYWPPLKWDPFESDDTLDQFMSEPTATHWMGTDTAGRDVLARLLYGARISLFFALAVWFVTYVVGTILGMTQGFFGGKVDLLGQRVVEIFSSIPEFYLLLLLITILAPNVFVLVIISSLFGWVGISQYMRAETLKNRGLVYAEAARSLGASPARVLRKHILPNSLIPIITFSPFAIVGGVTALAALDLLGFGVPAPTPSWGELLDQARANYQVAWWLAFFPSLFLFVTVVCFNLVGEALRSAFDPKC
jgi:microcin C transport system permease protein